MWLTLAFFGSGLVLFWLLHRFVFVPWASFWGSTPAEREMPIPGDDMLREGPAGRRLIRWTRGITVAAPPETIWPWIAQLGRGAGFYAVDWLDNGRRPSARHLVSWIPELRLGDAGAVGYVHSVELGRTLEWRLPRLHEAGHDVRSAFVYHLVPAGDATRVLVRVSGEVLGPLPRLFETIFRVVDTMMMRRQLLCIRERAERLGLVYADPQRPETGERDQFQLYHVVYASGEEAGVEGREKAPRWSAAAREILADRFGQPPDASRPSRPQ